jgi:hypothetical protein
VPTRSDTKQIWGLFEPERRGYGGGSLPGRRLVWGLALGRLSGPWTGHGGSGGPPRKKLRGHSGVWACQGVGKLWKSLYTTSNNASNQNTDVGEVIYCPCRSVSKSSHFLGDPPPNPRFLASLGPLSLVELDHCALKILSGRTCPNDLLLGHLLVYSTSDSVPSEPRKRGSGGGSPRKYDDLLRSGNRRTFFPPNPPVWGGGTCGVGGRV